MASVKRNVFAAKPGDELIVYLCFRQLGNDQLCILYNCRDDFGWSQFHEFNVPAFVVERFQLMWQNGTFHFAVNDNFQFHTARRGGNGSNNCESGVLIECLFG